MTKAHNKTKGREVVGLIPAAGQATRISPLPCSKELYPIAFGPTDGSAKRPKVVCHYLLEKMRIAGISKVYVVLRSGKWDIPAYLRDGSLFGLDLAYLIMNLPFGVPYSLDQAYSFVRDSVVAFGFPDILFKCDAAFTNLLRRLNVVAADIVLGLFPVDAQKILDRVDVDQNGRVHRLDIKARRSRLQFTWCIAVWTPTFTEFLHDYLGRHVSSEPPKQELSAGEVIQSAIAEGLRVDGIEISNEEFLDIGTPEDLIKASRSCLAEEPA